MSILKIQKLQDIIEAQEREIKQMNEIIIR
jgi:uncharacterized protein (DUF305 family)